MLYLIDKIKSHSQLPFLHFWGPPVSLILSADLVDNPLQASCYLILLPIHLPLREDNKRHSVSYEVAGQVTGHLPNPGRFDWVMGEVAEPGSETRAQLRFLLDDPHRAQLLSASAGWSRIIATG